VYRALAVSVMSALCLVLLKTNRNALHSQLSGHNNKQQQQCPVVILTHLLQQNILQHNCMFWLKIVPSSG